MGHLKVLRRKILRTILMYQLRIIFAKTVSEPLHAISSLISGGLSVACNGRSTALLRVLRGEHGLKDIGARASV